MLSSCFSKRQTVMTTKAGFLSIHADRMICTLRNFNIGLFHIPRKVNWKSFWHCTFKIQALICPLSFWVSKLQIPSTWSIMQINVMSKEQTIYIFISDGGASVIVWIWSPGNVLEFSCILDTFYDNLKATYLVYFIRVGLK
jgi:hypothetical protein